VLGTPQLAHVGAMEGIVAVTTMAGKKAKPINPEHIPNATYCHPEIGSVGLTEAKAEEAGYNLKVGKFPFTANSRASIVGQHEGFIKIVSDTDYGEILGVHIIGPQATETHRRSRRSHRTGSHGGRSHLGRFTPTLRLAEAMLDACK